MTLPESDDSSSGPPAKRLKLEDAPQPSIQSRLSLLDFCDDLMLEIFFNLNLSDLLALSQCCQRLKRVVQDRTLWINVDFRNVQTDEAELTKYLEFLLPTTKLFASRGSYTPPPGGPAAPPQEVPRQATHLFAPRNNHNPATDNEPPSFSGELLERISKAAPNLSALILENHVLDAQDVTWEKVPPLLEHLSLRNSLVIKCDASKSFFYGIDKSLPYLKILELSQCRWFESHSLLALSKCKQLQELRLADIPISDFVPYISLGVRFGFKSLTVVDFRRTWITDREVSCLNKVETLKELYLEAPEGGGTFITDVAVTAFGGSEEVWNRMGYLVLIMSPMTGPVKSALNVLELCNYSYITDTSLRHCSSCLKDIKRVNVKGTSCTQEGVLKFKSERPDVTVVSNFDLDVDSSNDSQAERRD